jgi:hypothetical protein
VSSEHLRLQSLLLGSLQQGHLNASLSAWLQLQRAGIEVSKQAHLMLIRLAGVHGHQDLVWDTLRSWLWLRQKKSETFISSSFASSASASASFVSSTSPSIMALFSQDAVDQLSRKHQTDMESSGNSISIGHQIAAQIMAALSMSMSTPTTKSLSSSSNASVSALQRSGTLYSHLNWLFQGLSRDVLHAMIDALAILPDRSALTAVVDIVLALEQTYFNAKLARLESSVDVDKSLNNNNISNDKQHNKKSDVVHRSVYHHLLRELAKQQRFQDCFNLLQAWQQQYQLHQLIFQQSEKEKQLQLLEQGLGVNNIFSKSTAAFTESTLLSIILHIQKPSDLPVVTKVLSLLRMQHANMVLSS